MNEKIYSFTLSLSTNPWTNFEEGITEESIPLHIGQLESSLRHFLQNELPQSWWSTGSTSGNEQIGQNKDSSIKSSS